MLSTVFTFPEGMSESSFLFCDGGHKFLQGVDVIMNLEQFDVLFDKKLSVIRMCLFFLLVSC